MPVGVRDGDGGGVVEGLDLCVGEAEVDGDEILFELFFVAGADDDGRDGGFAKEPSEGNLWDGLSGFLGDSVESVDDFVEVVFGNLGAGVGGDLTVEARSLRARSAAANSSSEASPAERAPDERADFLIDGEGHELPFVIAADERVVDLMGDVANPAVALGNGERLHQVPS